MVDALKYVNLAHHQYSLIYQDFHDNMILTKWLQLQIKYSINDDDKETVV